MEGLEPSTSWSTIRHSCQLSYNHHISGASWSWTTFYGFSVHRIHHVCQSSFIVGTLGLEPPSLVSYTSILSVDDKSISELHCKGKMLISHQEISASLAAKEFNKIGIIQSVRMTPSFIWAISVLAVQPNGLKSLTGWTERYIWLWVITIWRIYAKVTLTDLNITQ